jgi:hypothetical protein
MDPEPAPAPSPGAAPPAPNARNGGALEPVIERREHEPPLAQSPARRAGQLTAADHDDLLNPDLYQAYADRFRQRLGRKLYPAVDTGQQLRIRVVDRDGRPAPLSAVTVRRADGEALRLMTKADGQVVVFPKLDRLGERVEASVTAADGRVVSGVAAPRPGAPRTLTLRLPGRAKPVQAVDVLLVMDTTGSMADELSYLTAELSDILGTVGERHAGVDIRAGLLFYRDLGDAYTVRTYPFTGDRQAVQASLAHQSANGGGDFPEAMQVALQETDAYPWREGAVKLMLLVADAPPHESDRAQAWTSILSARERGIQVVPVAASGVDDDAQYLMRAAAAVSQSRYIFITDDSGIGAAHAEPSVDCYVVTRLNDLIGRVIDGLVSGRRVEAEPDAVIRQVGRYDRGVCRR